MLNCRQQHRHSHTPFQIMSLQIKPEIRSVQSLLKFSSKVLLQWLHFNAGVDPSELKINKSVIVSFVMSLKCIISCSCWPLLFNNRWCKHNCDSSLVFLEWYVDVFTTTASSRRVEADVFVFFNRSSLFFSVDCLDWIGLNYHKLHGHYAQFSVLKKMSHKLNLCPKGQAVFQAAASIWFGVPRRRNPSCKPIWLSSHDLSLQVWILSMICGFKSPALQDNWDWLSCVSVENNRRLKAGWIKKKKGGSALKVPELLLICHYVK